MASRIKYSFQAEQAKRELVRKMMEGVKPVIILPFHEGMIAGTVKTSRFRKIRQVHDAILFAAVGEHQDINEAAHDLTMTASAIVNALSSRDLSINILVDDPAGIVGQIAAAFRSLDIRPKAVEFVLTSFEDERLGGVIINPCGERKDVNEYALIGDDGSFRTRLEQRQEEVRPETKEKALNMIVELLKETGDVSEVEVGVLQKTAGVWNFEHSWEDVQ